MILFLLLMLFFVLALFLCLLSSFYSNQSSTYIMDLLREAIDPKGRSCFSRGPGGGTAYHIF